MFKNPAYTRRPLRFMTTPDPAPGGGNAPATKDEDLGFPKDTPVDQMEPAQQAAYWKNQSKVQQKAREDAEKASSAYGKFGTVEDLQSAADAAETARLAALDENQRAIENAKKEGRTEALSENQNTHLDTAVKGMLIALTKGAEESFEDAQERVSGAIEFADLTKFVGENGTLDAAKVQTFAKSIGSAGNGDVSTPSNAAWGAQYDRDHAGRVPPTPGAAGSVATMQEAAYDRMKKKTA